MRLLRRGRCLGKLFWKTCRARCLWDLRGIRAWFGAPPFQRPCPPHRSLWTLRPLPWFWSFLTPAVCPRRPGNLVASVDRYLQFLPCRLVSYVFASYPPIQSWLANPPYPRRLSIGNCLWLHLPKYPLGQAPRPLKCPYHLLLVYLL